MQSKSIENGDHHTKKKVARRGGINPGSDPDFYLMQLDQPQKGSLFCEGGLFEKVRM